MATQESIVDRALADSSQPSFETFDLSKSGPGAAFQSTARSWKSLASTTVNGLKDH
jgi:hypothetical protein